MRLNDGVLLTKPAVMCMGKCACKSRGPIPRIIDEGRKYFYLRVEDGASEVGVEDKPWEGSEEDYFNLSMGNIYAAKFQAEKAKDTRLSQGAAMEYKLVYAAEETPQKAAKPEPEKKS